MKKKIIIGLACIMAGVGAAGCAGSNNQETTTDTITTAETTTLMQETTYDSEGFSDLQLFYLSLNEKESINDVKQKAKSNGYYIEIDSDVNYTRLYISEKESLGIGSGSSTWYQYDTDSISLYFDSNDELFSKDYRYQSDHMTVSYTFYENEIELENSIAGETERGKIEIPTEKFNDVKKAIKYINEKR